MVMRNRSVSDIPLPPEQMRWRVVGNRDPKGFLESGKKSVKVIEFALEQVGKSLSLFEKMLDFGCGCGRIIRWFSDLPNSIEVFGTDYDDEAIAWCQDNLEFAEFITNKKLPPLDFPSNAFDFIYAISIFTHLDEEYQFQWLKELKRVSKQKGILHDLRP